MWAHSLDQNVIIRCLRWGAEQVLRPQDQLRRGLQWHCAGAEDQLAKRTVVASSQCVAQTAVRQLQRKMKRQQHENYSQEFIACTKSNNWEIVWQRSGSGAERCRTKQSKFGGQPANTHTDHDHDHDPFYKTISSSPPVVPVQLMPAAGTSLSPVWVPAFVRMAAELRQLHLDHMVTQLISTACQWSEPNTDSGSASEAPIPELLRLGNKEPPARPANLPVSGPLPRNWSDLPGLIAGTSMSIRCDMLTQLLWQASTHRHVLYNSDSKLHDSRVHGSSMLTSMVCAHDSWPGSTLSQQQ